MGALTSKERMYLEEALRLENMCVAKYNVYADKCQDDDLKAELFALSKSKRRNSNRIKQLLNQQATHQYYQ